NGNFRNSYRGGWNDTPFDNVSREQFNYNYQIPHDWGFHYAHDMHLPYQTPAHYYDMSHPTHQMSAHYPDMRPLPHQVPATILNPSKKRVPLCEICHVKVPSKDIELHNNGKKHRRNLKSKECITSKGEVSGHIQNSQMNPVVQPKEVPKSMKDG
ncbi:hypothetical protein A2U01_0047416, partial [Trifolium medium]|nr:hypothetical protein [Trifolium medium]